MTPTPFSRGARMHRVVLFPALLAASLAGACRTSTGSEPPTGTDRAVVTAGLGREITLAPGGTAKIDEANLYLKVESLNDSRCPTRALIQCVWAGSVRVRLLASAINGPDWIRTMDLETVTPRDTATVSGQLVRLVRVTPERETVDSIPLPQYRVVLQVGTR